MNPIMSLLTSVLTFLYNILNVVVLFVTCGKVQLPSNVNKIQNNKDTSICTNKHRSTSIFNLSSTHCDDALTRRKIMSESNIDYTIQPWNIDSSKIGIINEYVETPNGHIIYTKCMLPLSKNGEISHNIKGMIFYCHGYASQSDWTELIIGKKYVLNNYIFFINDHYGHGRSDGIWMYITNFNNIINDSQFIFHWAKLKYSHYLINKNTKINYENKQNYFLMGQSMGGAIAISLSLKNNYNNISARINKSENITSSVHNSVNKTMSFIKNIKNDDIKENNNNNNMDSYELQLDLSQKSIINEIKYNPIKWNGMILLAPMVSIDENTRPNETLVKILTFLLDKISFLQKSMLVPSRKLTPFCTRSDEMNMIVTQNPLYFDYKPRLKTGIEINKFCMKIEKQLSNINIPYLLCHGSDDQIINIKGSKLIYNQSKSKDKTFKIYKNAYHLLLLDLCKDEVWNDINTWITDRLH